MSFDRWGYTFDGAHTDPSLLEARAGVYVVWCKNGDDWHILDVGEAGDVQNRLLTHDREDCWRRNCEGVIYFSATYTPNMPRSGRMRIEATVRAAIGAPCGTR